VLEYVSTKYQLLAVGFSYIAVGCFQFWSGRSKPNLTNHQPIRTSQTIQQPIRTKPNRPKLKRNKTERIKFKVTAGYASINCSCGTMARVTLHSAKVTQQSVSSNKSDHFTSLNKMMHRTRQTQFHNRKPVHLMHALNTSKVLHHRWI